MIILKTFVSTRGAITFASLILLLLAGLELQSAQVVADFTGVVTIVFDGDTVIVRTSNKKVRVRLDEIDAPEHDQDWGDRSRQALADIVLGRRVSVRTHGMDDYGRTLGRLYLAVDASNEPPGFDINAEMVRSGNAWAYRRYLIDASLLALEDEARRARRGLWSMPGPVPPWQYRHPGGSFEQLFRHSEPDSVCGNKRYCRDMVSCEEAKMYLDCGITDLDGDGDGSPCEAICSKN